MFLSLIIAERSPDFDPLDEHHIEVRYREFRVTSCQSFGLCDTSDPVTMEVANKNSIPLSKEQKK